jgi:hypothetical protein
VLSSKSWVQSFVQKMSPDGEMVDTLASGASGRKAVGVQVSLWAQFSEAEQLGIKNSELRK